MIERLWASFLSGLRPSFGIDDTARSLTLTFGLLAGLFKFLVALTVIWAMAAGVLQTARLIAYIPQGFPGNAKGVWVNQADWLAPIVAIFVYTLKAFGATTLVGLAAALIGGFLGFLFGVPRPISEAAAPLGPLPSTPIPRPGASAAAGQAASQAGGADRATGVPAVPTGQPPAPSHAGRAWESSTNLTQISDWLTKIIVGIGLVEASNIYSGLAQLSTVLSDRLFDGAAGSRLAIPAVMIAGAILGFLYAYLFTQLFLARLFVVTDYNLRANLGAAFTTLSTIPPASPAIASPFRTDPGTPPVDQPTPAQTEAASLVASLPLGELTEPVQILAWGRSHAGMNNYPEAALAYRRLLNQVRTPEVLAEAARVFSASDQPREAESALAEAVRGRDDVSPEVRFRITFDAASLALYEPPPGGYQRALDLLDEHTLAYDPAGWLRVLRACANAQRYRHDLATASDQQKAESREAVLKDLRLALLLTPAHRNWIRYLWDPNTPNKPPLGSPDRDDDLEIFFDDPDFKDLLG